MDNFLNKLANYKDRISLIAGERFITFNELAERIRSSSTELQKKIPQGSVVALISSLSIESIFCFLALTYNKNIIVPITELNDSEQKNRIIISGAEYLLRIQNSAFNVEKIDSVQVHSEPYQKIINNQHPGLVLFSSGITGVPKGMVHDLYLLMTSFLTKKVKDVNFLAALLFDHIGGLNTIFSALFSGATLTIPESRDPYTICKVVEQHKVNVLPASPTILNLILISEAYLKFDLSSIRVITYGTEPMPEGLLVKLNQAFPHTKFIQTFGTSETGIAQVSSKSSASTMIKFNDPHTEYKIVDGELLIKSNTMIMGYLNAGMDQFTSDGWFKTGDLAEIDKDGYMVISGRKNEIINVAGLKVYPQEVESVLMELPIVLNCMVYGEKNPITGNIVLAKVKIPEATDKKFASDEIRSHLRKKLDLYKVPLKIFFVNSIDHNNRFKKIRNL